MPNVKAEVLRLLDHLPDDVTWDDLMHVIYVRREIEAGLRDSDEGRTVPVDEVRRRFGLGARRTFTGDDQSRSGDIVPFQPPVSTRG